MPRATLLPLWSAEPLNRMTQWQTARTLHRAGTVASFASFDELFRVDDGSLPEIRIEGMTQGGIVHALRLVTSLSLDKPKYAHPLGASAPEGTNHFVVRLQVDGVELPELGVAAFKDALVFDYRMG